MKEWLTRLGNSIPPEQARALSKVLLLIGLAIFAKIILFNWPSFWATGIRTGLLVLMFVYATKYLRLVPRFKIISKILPVVFIAGMLNQIAMFANGGYMPSVIRTIESASGIYIPLEGTNLIYLSDWIWRGFSPGDIIMLVAFVVMTIMCFRRTKSSSVESEPAGAATQVNPQKPTLIERIQS